ncbi:MAG TPA: ATP-binding protein [Thermoanaerobaculia bacterium]|nr:ATP-binding protein [Thermoanaerobaculia bacterium]
MRPLSRRIAETLLLLVAAATPLVPGWPAPLLLAVLALGWLALAPPRREQVIAGVAILLAVAALAVRAALAPAVEPADPGWRAATLANYEELWQELAAEAERARQALPDAAGVAENPVAVFRQLAAIAPAEETGRGALLLVDPDGTPVAWAGEGLLHELAPEAIPRAGADFRASFAAVTALVVAPVDELARRPWRVVAARSFATDRLPFAPGAGPGPPLRWSLVGVPAEAAPGALVLELASGPDLVIDPEPAASPSAPTASAAARSPYAVRAGRVAGLALAFALFALAVARGVGIALPGEETEAAEAAATADPDAPGSSAGAAGGGGRAAGSGASVAVLATTSAVVTGAALGAAAAVLVALPLATALVIAGAVRARRPSGGRPASAAVEPQAEAGGEAPAGPRGARRPWPLERRPRAGQDAAGANAAWRGWVAGATAVGILTAVALLLERLVGPGEGGPVLFGSATAFVGRVFLAATAAGLLALAASLARRPPPSRSAGGSEGRADAWAWAAVVSLLAGAAACDFPWAALPLFALGGAAAVHWLAGRTPWRPVEATVLTLIAALAAAGVGEAVARWQLRGELAVTVAPRAAPPTAEEVAALDREVAAAFADLRLADFVPRSPASLESQDLAFLLWQASPLAHPHALSALVVRPPGGPPSIFGFGLALTEEGLVDWSSLGWSDLAVGEPEEVVVAGQGALFHQGEPWGRLEWTLVPMPGYRLAPRQAVEQIEVALLRGGPSGRPLPGLPETVDVALYDRRGRAIASPWREAPPLPAALADGGRARVATPEGRTWAVARRAGGGWSVLYLPVLSPLAGLERVGSQALGLLLLALLLATVALLVALPRAAFRQVLGRTVRSYSKRLLLVYTLLLLVPLLLLNTVLVAGMGDRLRREQRAAGEGALAAGQRVLVEYLASLEPGFDLASELDDSLLQWLSGVVRHEVNLYWGSEIWASTKPELFAARLLPKRIPGESYSRLALRGYERASRTNRVGEVSYLELYAPLALPGEEVGPRNFFLSMPLLAQQEEAARELDAVRRQALLVTAALVVLVTAVGVRLSKSFTRPLTELVEGTRRIAAGAPSLDLAPSELELAALVEAVDDMAHRIARGRERLVREKQVVERIVEHITSGVVSLDRDRRVLMRNRVAAELLEVEVGDLLPEVVASRRRLAPVAAWLPEVAGELAQRTVRLPAARGSGEAGGDGGEAVEREWTLVWVPVPGSGDPAALLVVEDATETLRGQRLEAWAEMARIIAHEIKNPLTPIRLNVEHMQQVWRDGAGRRGEASGGDRFDDIFTRCTDNVLAQVDELQQIAAEFSTYSRIPKIDPQPGDLAAMVGELAAPYRQAPPAGVSVEVEVPAEPLVVRFDRRLLARALRNLIENALRASAGGGRVSLRVERRPAGGEGGDGRDGAEARIAVVDCGAGVAPELLPRIFDPYFSTHDTGTGLGLPIARRIAEEHGGTITARNRPEGGLEVAITLPLG